MPRTKEWLVSRSGPSAGSRYLLSDGVTRIGRGPENDVLVQGPQCATVSLFHAEVARHEGGFRVRDAGSTNGTFLNGERITEADLGPDSVIRLGNDGPEFAYVVEAPASAELDRTLVIPDGIQLATPPAPAPAAETHEVLLTEAVTRARHARVHGAGDQTMTIMRELLRHALGRTRRRFRFAVAAMAALLIATSAYGYWRITRLKTEKTSVDQRIQEIEARLEKIDQNPAQADQLISELNAYQDQAANIERSALYRYGVRKKQDFVLDEIHSIMTELGSEVYSVPPDFVERVNYYIKQYQGPDRALMENALVESAGKVQTMRRILEGEKLPPDFAYLPLVESALAPRTKSPEGAAGPWQFTPATARAFGLRVEGKVDDRYDLRKSTQASCKYLRQLILDFGSGSSVMLALAAYNLGPSKVKQAISRVDDPIKQRSFWYLYRIRALPAETREYVPKVFAAIIIGRAPEKFGF